MAWNAEVGGWRRAALSLTSGLLTGWAGRRVRGWMGVMAVHPHSLLLL